MSVQEWAGTAARPQEEGGGRAARRARSLRWLKRRAWRRAVISAALLWHFVALALWLLPSWSGIVGWGLGNLPVRPYMTFTGLMQDWHMFSPNPDDLDAFIEAKITYQSGRTALWRFPRMAKLGYARRYQQERWRKIVEVMTHNDDRFSLLRPALARYAARVNNRRPADPPVQSELIEHFRTVQPPGTSPKAYASASFYTLAVRPEDLR